MKTHLFVSLLLLAPTTCLASDNPFGFETQRHPSKYGYCEPEEEYPDIYFCMAAPKPHPELKFYSLRYVDNVGLCKIIALGKTIKRDAYGAATRDRVDRIAGQVAQKYGKETDKFDYLKSGSIWKESQYWMQGLYRNERSYVYYWTRNAGFKPVGDIISIGVAATAFSSNNGSVRVEFETKHLEQCDEEAENRGASSF